VGKKRPEPRGRNGKNFLQREKVLQASAGQSTERHRTLEKGRHAQNIPRPKNLDTENETRN